MPIEGVLLDIEGVLTVSWEPLPGAAEGLAGLRSDEVPFRLLTNTTELTRAQVRERLASAGLAVAAEEIVTAPLLTAAHLRDEHPGARCHLLAAPGIVEDLEGVDLDGEEASVVVVGGSTEPFTVEQMRLALRLVLGGAALVAMHRSAAWMTAQGMTLDAGVMLVAGLEEATGRKAVVCGKPARECFERSAALIGVTPARTAMVGDDIANDILAGQAAGLTGSWSGPAGTGRRIWSEASRTMRSIRSRTCPRSCVGCGPDGPGSVPFGGGPGDVPHRDHPDR